MAVPITRVTIVGPSNEKASGVDDLLSLDTTAPELLIPALRAYLQRVGAGVRAATVYVAVDSATDATVASGTITLSNLPTANDTVIIGDTTFTFKSSAPAAGDVLIGASVTATSVNLVAKILAHSALTGVVTASSAAGVTTVSAVTPGKWGNLIRLAEGVDSGSVIAVSGATLSGGSGTVQSAVATYRYGT
jgi:hypothetical protein